MEWQLPNILYIRDETGSPSIIEFLFLIYKKFISEYFTVFDHRWVWALSLRNVNYLSDISSELYIHFFPPLNKYLLWAYGRYPWVYSPWYIIKCSETKLPNQSTMPGYIKFHLNRFFKAMMPSLNGCPLVNKSNKTLENHSILIFLSTD